jgi:hypothetical protein
MKHFLMMIAIAAAAVLAAATAARGQSFESVKFHLDSQTRIGAAVLAPGDYEIRQLDLAGDGSKLEISSNSVRYLVTAMIETSNTRFTQTEVLLTRTAELPRVSLLRIGGTSTAFRITPFDEK